MADKALWGIPLVSGGPIDSLYHEKIDRWLENKKEVGKRELKSNHHKKVNTR